MARPRPGHGQGPAPAGELPAGKEKPEEPRPRYFYRGYDYGSQALFNPLWVLINRSFDVLQDHTDSRFVFSLDYGRNGLNVLDNLAHPFSAIANRGWGNFLTQEIFPLSFTQDTARWVPNYNLHLIAGGVTYVALGEWFEDHGVPLPRVFSAAVILASAFLNESIENKGVRGPNTDAIADIYFFDIGGIVLFSFDVIKRFFSQKLIIADWSLQPCFTFPQGELHNQGNYFAAKFFLPFGPPAWRRLGIFSYFGETTTGGLTLRLDSQYSVSAAAGGIATRLVNRATHAVDNIVRFAPTGGVFVDRNESLLASLQIADVEDYFIHLNVYPHALFQRGPGIGLWTVVDKHARVAFGLSFVGLLGMGPGWTGL